MNPALYDHTMDLFWFNGKVWATSLADESEEISIGDVVEEGNTEIQCHDRTVKRSYYPASWDQNTNTVVLDRTVSPLVLCYDESGVCEDDVYTWDTVHRDWVEYEDEEIEYEDTDDCIPADKLSDLHY
jgi:hypothetical protein